MKKSYSGPEKACPARFFAICRIIIDNSECRGTNVTHASCYPRLPDYLKAPVQCRGTIADTLQLLSQVTELSMSRCGRPGLSPYCNLQMRTGIIKLSIYKTMKYYNIY